MNLSWQEGRDLEMRLWETGRTFATENIGSYQTDQMAQSMENISLLYWKKFQDWPVQWSFGIQWMKEQWERTHFTVLGNSVDDVLGLSEKGKPQGGLREELSNIGFPLGLRMRWGTVFFVEGEALWSFLLDPSDVFLGSSPNSGFTHDLSILIGANLKKWTFSTGWLQHAHHMAAPVSGLGKRLNGGVKAPEGIWVAWPENEVLFQGLILQMTYRF